MDLAIDAALTVLSTLNPNDWVSVMSFDDKVYFPESCAALAPATPRALGELKQFVSNLKPQGGTVRRLSPPAPCQQAPACPPHSNASTWAGDGGGVTRRLDLGLSADDGEGATAGRRAGRRG